MDWTRYRCIAHNNIEVNDICTITGHKSNESIKGVPVTIPGSAYLKFRIARKQRQGHIVQQRC